MTQAASGDARLREKPRQCKSGWKASEEEKKWLTEANKKFKRDLAAVACERDNFSKTIIILDKEKKRPLKVRELRK